jgi:hypothetical protein
VVGSCPCYVLVFTRHSHLTNLFRKNGYLNQGRESFRALVNSNNIVYCYGQAYHTKKRNVNPSLVNGTCFFEVLITNRMSEKATMYYDNVLRALTITQGTIRLKLDILSKIQRNNLKHKREGN